MRDLVLTCFIFGSLPFLFRRPWLGVLMCTWLSVMNPHRMSWGFAYNMPFAQVVGLVTLFGMLGTRDPKHMPWTPVTVMLLVFVLWMNLTTLTAIDTPRALLMWDRVMKIQLMIFVTLYLLHSKEQIFLFVAVVTGSLAFFGIKGGIYTILGGGGGRVWGPEGSFIADNNQLALAIVMTIPLLRWLQLQATRRWMRLALLGAMVLCAFAALGSQSRGALIAIGAMVVFLWLKGRQKFVTLIALILLVPAVIGFMPDKWTERMHSIGNYEVDASATGRINAWMMAINLTKDRPIYGGGFEVDSHENFARYAPNPNDVQSAHSIYFQVLGEHGYVGLAIYLSLWLLVWGDASRIIRLAGKNASLQWAADLARMVQVSLAGFAVGGAFLNLAHFDVPYDLLAALVLTRVLVEKEIAGQTAGGGAAALRRADPLVPQRGAPAGNRAPHPPAVEMPWLARFFK